MKYPKVTICNSAEDYIVTVAVYRHVSSPDKISVHIQSIYPIPPREPQDPSDPACKLVPPGETEEFDPTLYPPRTHF